ncbi:MAG: protein-L-isoaspartate(D-aspartate) O-methyltransferase [Bacteroidota bacterium]
MMKYVCRNICLVFSVLIMSMVPASCQNTTDSDNNQEQANWKSKASTMIKDQIIARGITDKKVLASMENVPRHKFVPEEYSEHAYTDSPLPIGHKQTISQPYIVALMTSALELEGDEKVLEIGTGSGYQAAVLARIVDTVYSIEIVEKLAERAGNVLKELGYYNVVVKHGDGYKGWEEHAPFDRIILTAAPEKIPGNLLEQLKPGGIMVTPVGTSQQVLQKLRKTEEGDIEQETMIGVRFVPMIHSDE